MFNSDAEDEDDEVNLVVGKPPLRKVTRRKVARVPRDMEYDVDEVFDFRYSEGIEEILTKYRYIFNFKKFRKKYFHKCT